MTIEKINQEIYKLLESKKWEELNGEEKKLVTKSLGKEYYERMYELHSRFILTKRDAVPEIGPLTVKKKKSFIVKLFELKIPAYQAAAILIVALLVSTLIDNNNTRNNDFSEKQMDVTAEYSRSLQEDSLATVFISGMYR